MKWFAAIAGALLLATSGCASYDDWGGGYGSVYGGYPVGGIGINVGAISDFYGPLSPYGSWFMDPFYGMVFQPYGLGAGWMPYSLGYWADTPRYGRMWRSDEPFGWATYHYGRWTQNREHGWFWVPGTKFTPGAVRWSNNGSRVGWEALAPTSRNGVRAGNIGQQDRNGWIYAPRARLGSPDLSRYTSRGVAGSPVPGGVSGRGSAGQPGWMARTARPAGETRRVMPGVTPGGMPGAGVAQTPAARPPQAMWRRNGEGITFDRNQGLSDTLPVRRSNGRPNAPGEGWQGESTPRAAPSYRNGGAWNGSRGGSSRGGSWNGAPGGSQEGSWGRGDSRGSSGSSWGGGHGGGRHRR